MPSRKDGIFANKMIKDMVKYVIEYDMTNMMSYTYETRHCVEEFGDDLDNFCLRAKRIRGDKDKRNIQCYKVIKEHIDIKSF